MTKARVVKLVDTRDLKSLGEPRPVPVQVRPRAPKRLTLHEQDIIRDLVRAIYPILIPVEAQCVEIQENNYAELEKLATKMWKSFKKVDTCKL